MFGRSKIGPALLMAMEAMGGKDAPESLAPRKPKSHGSYHEWKRAVRLGTTKLTWHEWKAGAEEPE